jgi:hypothetical protein
MLSLFLVSGYVYVCQEYRCSLCSLWVVMYICVRNIDVVSVPCEWSRQHRYSWQTYTWPLTRNRDYIDIPNRHIHNHTTRNRDNIDIPDTHIYDVSVPCEWLCICLSGISMLSLFLVSGHVYVCQEYKEQRQHRYSWQTYTWPLTRNRDYIDIPNRHIHNHTTRNRDNIDNPDTHIHDHTTRMLSLFLVSGYVYVCQEYRCCLCSL